MGLWSSFKASLAVSQPPVPRAPSVEKLHAFVADQDAPVSRAMAIELAKEAMAAIDDLHAKLHSLDARQWFYDLTLLYILYKAYQI